MAAAVSALIGGVVGLASPASAAASWKVVASPNPPATTYNAYNALAAVSCTSATNCVAVGNFTSPSGTLVERWNGTRWKIVPSAPISGGILSGVSCPSATTCIAVGSHSPPSATTTGTLVERWNGTSWKIVASPNVSGAFSLLSGVSCASPTNCIAVGYSQAKGTITEKSLVERWNGTSVNIVASPNPPDGSSALSGVSCTSPSNCFAVGDAMFTGRSTTWVERWNGTSVKVVASPNPTGVALNVLSGVSCANATTCVAVGDYEISGTKDATGKTLVERWNGTSWKIAASANPIGKEFSLLDSVSCASPTNCIAVGDDSANGDTIKTLTEGWNGTNWKIVPSPNPIGTDNSLLSGVSCTSATNCTAVGNDLTGRTTKTLVEQYS